ncbi:MAG: maleylacetate reductase [Flavisolibacter sp.]
MNFEYRSFPSKIYFGYGKTRLLPQLLKDYDKVMIIASNRMSEQVAKLSKALGADHVSWFSNIVQHVPETLMTEARAFREDCRPAVLVSIGGGSAIGLSKALALDEYIPQIVIPSTFSGSEQTNIYGISLGGVKRTGRDDRVLPGTVIYDPELALSMPKDLAVTSAMNAMAHVMEAMYSPSGNPVTSHIAMQGMITIQNGIKELAGSESLTRGVAEKLLLGSFLAGKCLCEVEMALHHKAAHVLGGSFNMEHSSVHTALQSYVLAYQWPYLSKEIQNEFKSVLESAYPPIALKELADKAGAKTNLKSIGFKEEDIERAVAMMVSKPYANVAPISKEGLEKMLYNAYYGKIESPG